MATLPATLPFVLGEGSEAPAIPQSAVAPQGATVDVTVRLQALSGQWETCGADRAIGVVPESVQCSANEWGADKASFDLHRSVVAQWPDIGAFTPVEIEIGGVIVWEGRVSQTPLRFSEQVISVQCEGWQYHLDDDVYQRTYVHSRLTDWKDSRSFLEAPLTLYPQAGAVQVQQGRIALGYANQAVVGENRGVGVTLDLGTVSPGAVFVAVDAELVGNGEGFFFFVIGHSGFSREPAGWLEQDNAVNSAALASGTYHGAMASPKRYVTLLVWREVSPVTMAGDLSLVIKGVRVFTGPYHSEASPYASTLKASQVVPDALERSTGLLSSDYSQIASTSFSIPDFVLAKASTARETITAANAYHNWITKLLPGRRMSFQPRPSEPQFELGAWSGADLSDTSANNAAEIFSAALVEASGTDGSALSIERSAAQQEGALSSALVPSTPAPGNPSFATNTATWSGASGATVTRDTGSFFSGPASGKLAFSEGSPGTVTETFSGTFHRGTLYRLALRVRGKLVLGLGPLTAKFGTASDYGSASVVPSETAWTRVTLIWTPRIDSASVTLRLNGFAGTVNVDDLVLEEVSASLPERRGFRRTKVIQFSSAITAAEGSQIADVFLQAHVKTPFKGSAAVLPGGCRKILGGEQPDPSRLLLHTQELMRLSHLIDPDTGGVGREGTIAEVSYSHAERKALVTLDDKRANFDALLARLAVVQGVGS